MARIYAQDMFDLVADIGGTNTRVALARDGHLLPETIHRFKNARFTSLADVLGAFLQSQNHVDCAGAAVALAGPVRGEVGNMTNLDWQIDHTTLRNISKAENIRVINDLQAQGYALDRLDTANLTPILTGAKAPGDASRLVIGLGTGFNAAPVYKVEGDLFVAPSEVGHAHLNTGHMPDPGLAEFITSHPPFAAIEDLLSGPGLARAYCYFAKRPKTEAPEPAEVIEWVHSGTDAAASKAMAAFVVALGQTCGDLALTHLPFGGVFLAGSVARALSPFLDDFGFQHAFCDKGRFQDFMADFAVTLVTDDFAALHGCAHILT